MTTAWTPIWCVSHPGGEPAYRASEKEAEHAATELVRSGKAKVATFYRILIHDNGGNEA